MLPPGKVALLATVFALPLPSLAATELLLNTLSCTGSASFSVDQAAGLECAGDFTLDGGYIHSDQDLYLRADGTLSLDNLEISAPGLFLEADTIALGLNTTLNVDQASIDTGGSLPTVPEQPPERAVIDWQPFDISSDNTVSFSQPTYGVTLPILPDNQYPVELEAAGSVFTISSPTPVPLPSGAWLLACGLGALLLSRPR